jgi:hypothetical protein
MVKMRLAISGDAGESVDLFIVAGSTYGIFEYGEVGTRKGMESI